MPSLLLLSGSGMATGGWLAGYLYDIYGYYAPAFATGVAFNVANIAHPVHAAGSAAHLRLGRRRAEFRAVANRHHQDLLLPGRGFAGQCCTLPGRWRIS